MKKEFTRFEPVVSINSRSVRFVRAASYVPSPENISKRGEIRSFSRHSALRLRQALADLHLPRYACQFSYGVTLTVPWQLADFKDAPDLFPWFVNTDRIFETYKAAFHRFEISFRRFFPNSACIFRHELQRRKMPHAHLVVYFSMVDLPVRGPFKSGELEQWLRVRIYDLWYRALKGFLGSGSVEGFWRSGIHIQRLDDLPSIFRYMCDHQSKKKQAQLGYKGKQWGFISKNLLVSRSFTRLAFNDSHELVLFQRAITKLCRYVRKDRTDRNGLVHASPFGYKKTTRPRLVSIQFVPAATSLRIYNWICSLRS